MRAVISLSHFWVRFSAILGAAQSRGVLLKDLDVDTDGSEIAATPIDRGKACRGTSRELVDSAGWTKIL